MPQKFVTIQSISYKILKQHTIWRIRCVDGDERRRTDVRGQRSVDGHWWLEGAERMELVEQNNDERQTKWQNKMEERNELQQTASVTAL
jgi:hypothetical protein